MSVYHNLDQLMEDVKENTRGLVSQLQENSFKIDNADSDLQSIVAHIETKLDGLEDLNEAKAYFLQVIDQIEAVRKELY